MTADLTDQEIDATCDGLVQNAAKVRYLQRMGLKVRIKPNGRPLVNRDHYNAVTADRRHDVETEPNWGVAA